MRTQVIGLGTVGLPTAIHISKFFDVVGCDISTQAQNRASLHIPVGPLEQADVYIVTVSTGITRDETPDMSAIYDVCQKISEVQAEALVSIESTVSVGTCRKVAETFDLRYIACCPHRYWPGDPEKYGVVQRRVLGALNQESMTKAKRFYSGIKIPIYPVSSLEISEMSKIVENSYRFIEIAYAEEIALVCQKQGLDFNEVRNACNTLQRKTEGWQVQIMQAKEGIGGECLPKDIRYLLTLTDSPILNGAIITDGKFKNREVASE